MNPITNTTYVADLYSSTVTAISWGACADKPNCYTTVSIPVGIAPEALTINPVTNKVYVANSSSGTVTIIDANNNNSTATVTVGSDPDAIVANPVTNLIFVADEIDNDVKVIDGASGNCDRHRARGQPSSGAGGQSGKQ